LAVCFHVGYGVGDQVGLELTCQVGG
jgi:hypothetical protein